MSKNQNAKVYSMVSIIVFAVVVLLDYLGRIGYINISNQAQILKNISTMITPVNVTFRIINIIYFLLFVTLIVAFIKSRNTYYGKNMRLIWMPFVISCILNVIWMYTFGTIQFFLSIVIVIGMFLSVLIILFLIRSNNGKTFGLFDIGFGVYGGWLSIVTMLNISAYLVSINFHFWGNVKIFYVGLIAIFILVAWGLQKIHQNPVFNIVIAWTFLGMVERIGFVNYFDPMFMILVSGMIFLTVVGLASLNNARIKL